MNKNIQTAIKVGAVALAILVSTGCASMKGENDALSARVDQLETNLAQAQSAADAAGANASEARQMASGAQSTPTPPHTAQKPTQACCDQTNDKLDRMFERGMAK
jgi:hypothetical protein